MAAKYTNSQAIEAARSVLDREMDEADTEATKTYRGNLINVSNNIRGILRMARSKIQATR